MLCWLSLGHVGLEGGLLGDIAGPDLLLYRAGAQVVHLYQPVEPSYCNYINPKGMGVEYSSISLGRGKLRQPPSLCIRPECIMFTCNKDSSSNSTTLMVTK